jgi:Tfp pilus assembly protein PilN
MRPVNLIPPEERRGDRAVLRKGSLAYGLVGALALILLGVVVSVMTNNQIADREAELATLEADKQAATARAEALAPYAEFAVMSAARNVTVSTLAKSRFDWERVLRELALVLPEDVWLVSAAGTVSPALTVEGSTGNPLRAQAPGPALELVGCAPGQDSVAALVAALKDIDGVTRVGLSSSERPDEAEEGAVGGDSAGGGGSEDCRTRDFIAKFEIVVAFDAVTVPEPGATAPETTPTTTPATTAPATDPAAAEVPGAEETAASQQEARNSTSEQTGRAGKAADILTGDEK